MASYGDETKQYHRERVREILVIKPNATPRTIKETLAAHPNSPLNLDIAYIRKHLAGIRGERSLRHNREVIERTIAELEDKTEAVVVEMWKILLDSSLNEVRGGIGARVQAGKVILDAQHELINAKMDAGIYTRKIGAVDVDHHHEHIHRLDPALKAQIIGAFKNYGIIRDAKHVIVNAPELPAAGAHGGAA